MKKLLIAPIIILLASCSKIAGLQLANRNLPPKLDELILSYKQEGEGYTKKTVFYLTDDERQVEGNFHNHANIAQRATYYNADESALLMGDYGGGFNNINSGYKNIDEGTRHFIRDNEVEATVENLFTAIIDDWADEQSIGDYYPTLTSLSELIDEEKWAYSTGVFTYSIENLELIEGEYNDVVLHKFQYFAAPMLLQTLRFTWTSVKVEEKENYLSIRLYSSEVDQDKVLNPAEGGEVLISEARVFKGINL